MIKVLFLDIDGVMNSEASKELARQRRSAGEVVGWISAVFAPWSVAALNRITDTTGASIVISSTWRLTAVPYLRRAGVRGDIIDMTPVLDRKLVARTRGQEIGAWLERWPTRPGAQPVSHFVILDDDRDMDQFNDRLVQTVARGRGLTDDHATAAIALLTSAPTQSVPQAHRDPIRSIMGLLRNSCIHSPNWDQRGHSTA